MKNNTRRKYREAIRTKQPKNIIISLAKEYHSLVREHSRVRQCVNRENTLKEMEYERRRCAKDIWKFSRNLLDDNNGSNVDPTFTKESCYSFFQSTYMNSNDVGIQNAAWMSPRKLPFSPFNSSEITMEEIRYRLQKSRNGSSPGPIDQVPYSILKRCPSCSLAMLHIFNCCLSSSVFPSAWQVAIIKLLSKSAAKFEATNPSNFRPIALTSSIGKIFTAILKDRVLHYAIENAYLDTSIQKAFVDGIPGCLENHLKLTGMIQEAKNQQKNLVMCWIDLANAYGSVRHDLIQLALRHYHLPESFISLIKSMYSNLSAMVVSKSWCTESFPLQIGIFQGDPLSVVIFNLVMNLYVEFIQEHYHQLGYCFSGSSHVVPLLQYADDSCLTANCVDNCQIMCKATDKWLLWANMTAKVPKCRVLEIKRGKVEHNTQLLLNGIPVPHIQEDPLKFLGLPISNSLDDLQHRNSVKEKLEKMMKMVDSTNIRRKQKLKVFSIGVCPRLSWLLMIMMIPLTWIERNLDTIATSFLKKWAGLAKCATPSIIHLKTLSGGLNIPSVSSSYKKLQVSRLAQFMMSCDTVVRFLADRILKDESNTVGRAFLPSIIVRDTLSSNPGMSKASLKRQSSMAVSTVDDEARLDHLRSLEVQGECYRISNDMCTEIWISAVQTLPDIMYKFVLNAGLDTLPHRKNLRRWKKSDSDQCPLCGETQSLLHVLNSCRVALSQRRYDNRHDTILTRIVAFIKNQQTDLHIIADLPTVEYDRPDFLISDLRPDIVMWNEERKLCYLIELTVCYDTITDKAQERKALKYMELAEGINSTSMYMCNIITLQVGSRGFIDVNSFKALKSIIKMKNKDFKNFLTEIAADAIIGSFKIWSRRNSGSY